ncbi:MAG: threonine synthase [Francisellaceae bacterium]|jgi:threonine synthase|nr:threonine synthase [Francisellaceae bacterium]MBT6208318.1 threonine synthase [Francisellaceae bacterium]
MISLIEKYKKYLPVTDNTPIISIGEGDTPLIKLNNIFKELDSSLNVFAKFEGLNPTGSFKDRGMTLALSKAKEEGATAVICASTGNTSAAAAAYSARAGIRCIVIVPSGQIALGKLAQAMIHGAQVLQIDGNFDKGLEVVKQLQNDHHLVLVNSMNPYRRKGQKTAAFEIVDSLGQAPDYHAIPVGNAANIAAYWEGYKEYSENLPKMLGYQASGAAPMVLGANVQNPETIATAIRIGAPQSYDLAKSAQMESKGWFASITDEMLIATQLRLASTEGIFAEPASIASIAGLYEDIKLGKIAKGSLITCTLTGHGLKDPNVVINNLSDRVDSVSADYGHISEHIGSYLNVKHS